MTGPNTLAHLLRSAFPHRSTVSPAEVASILIGLRPDDRGHQVDALDKARSEGKSLPGLRRSGGIWRLPVEALAGLSSNPVEAQPKKRRSKHATIGPRLLLQRERSREALQAVLDAFSAEVADEQARALRSATPEANGPTRPPGLRRTL